MTDTRTHLLAAARRCVAEHGLAATTSRMITSEADANLAAITYHFGSKDALVSEALLTGVREWLAPALTTLAAGGDPAARSLAGIQQLLAGYQAHRDLAPALLEALVHAPRSPELRTGILALWDDLRTGLAHDMTEMVARGELPGWVDPDVMATLFIALAQGLVLQVTVDPDGPDITTLAAQFATLLLAARPDTDRTAPETQP